MEIIGLTQKQLNEKAFRGRFCPGSAPDAVLGLAAFSSASAHLGAKSDGFSEEGYPAKGRLGHAAISPNDRGFSLSAKRRRPA